MTAISASTVSLKTLADGTLRISFDFDPKDAQDAFRLFASPGTSVGIAALKDGHGAIPDKPETHSVGPLAYWLVMRCKEPQFWEWLVHKGFYAMPGESAEDACRRVTMSLCGCLESRKEIDGNPDKTERFHSLIRGPYSKWLAAKGLT